MKFPVRKVQSDEFPKRLREIHDPPDSLYARGSEFPQAEKYLCVVGSRKHTNYGRDVCQKLISGLVGSSICIVSGLALGMDAIAHKAALKANLPCIGVPGSGLNDKVLYPKTNKPLAKKLLTSGNMLISEFEPDFEAVGWAFPKRNRIMAGLSQAVLVVEATEQSGTLITARLATEYNRDVFTVPGSIKSKNTAGPHGLIRDGAALIRSGEDILRELNLPTDNKASKDHENLTAKEEKVIEALDTPKPKDDLLQEVDMPAAEANVLISRLELKGLLKESGGKIERL